MHSRIRKFAIDHKTELKLVVTNPKQLPIGEKPRMARAVYAVILRLIAEKMEIRAIPYFLNAPRHLGHRPGRPDPCDSFANDTIDSR